MQTARSNGCTSKGCSLNQCGTCCSRDRQILPSRSENVPCLLETCPHETHRKAIARHDWAGCLDDWLKPNRTDGAVAHEASWPANHRTVPGTGGELRCGMGPINGIGNRHRDVVFPSPQSVRCPCAAGAGGVAAGPSNLAAAPFKCAVF